MSLSASRITTDAASINKFLCLCGWFAQGIGSKHLAPHVRGLAAVLLRRALLVDEPSLWDCLPPAADMGQGQGHRRGVEGRGGQRELQACLLQILSDEGDASVRRKVSGRKGGMI